MFSRLSFTLVFCCGLFTASGLAQAEPPDITPREFQLYMDWIDGREDPRLEGLTEKKKKKKIARSLKVKVKELEAAIEKVGPVRERIRPELEAGIRANLGKTPIQGQVLEVTVDDRDTHVVAYVAWKCGHKDDREQEAAYAAWAVGQVGALVGVVGLWCVDGKKTKLFSAQIGRSGFEKINFSRIKRFAARRYIRLFEQVKRGPHD